MSKSARWIRHSHLFSADDYECSVCHARFKMPHGACPNCHTPMKGAKYDPSWVDEMEMFDAIFDD